MKIVKDWLKVLLRKALAIPALEDGVQQLRSGVSDLDNNVNAKLADFDNSLNAKLSASEIFGLSYWYEGNLWEPPVQIALRDLCKPGDVVFDVGSNFGGLTTVMSRMVGLRGIVCAFEASPRIIGKCQRNIVLNGCSNVQVYHVAVFSRSQETVPIYLGSHLNDSIYSSSDTDLAAFNVPTLALDDFISLTGLVPNMVKMDIEGAEFDAITGMLNTISNAKPHLILETQPNDTQCLNLLREKGYVAIDLNSYREVKSSNDYPQGVAIRNNLYIHQDRLSESPYCPPFTFTEVTILTPDDFTTINGTLTTLKYPIKLNKGRYSVDVNFSAKGIDNEMMCGVKLEENVIFRYHANSNLLAQSYRDWVINLTENSEIRLYFEFLNNTFDETFLIRNIKIRRINEFDNISAPLYV